ncbi:MAG: glycosyltransferase family 2 protein [Patescibacteria group bacterium]|jgi:hypothetical protein
MDLSIIIVNYNNQEKLINCLNSLQLIVSLNYEIIVVDNASHDDLRSLVVKFPKIKLITSDRNLGMGGGNNLGIKNASGEYILILNPDTVVSAGAVETLFNYLKNNSGVGLVGPKLVYADGSLQYSCARFPSFFMPILRRTFLGDYFRLRRDSFQMIDFDHQTIKEVDWLMGSALMFKKEIVLSRAKVFSPHFDERYFMYFEDIDLCRQIWTKGLKVIYNPEAVVIHDHARESAKNPWYVALLKDKITWIHIGSWFKYFIKWGLFSSKKYVKN